MKRYASPRSRCSALEQVEDLRLHRNVEGARRFVADHQFRVHRQGARNRDPLTLPAGELVRIPQRRLRRQADLPQQLDDPLLALRARPEDVERAHALHQDVVHPHPRVERRVGVLEHDLELGPAPPERLAAQGGQRRPLEVHLPCARADELQDALAHGRLAATRFADERQRAPGRIASDTPSTACTWPTVRLKIPRRIGKWTFRSLHLEERPGRPVVRDRHLAEGRRDRDGSGAFGLPEVAAHELAVDDARPARRLGPAPVEDVLAAVGEATTGKLARKRRYLAGDDLELGAALAGAGKRGEEFPRVRMLRRAEESIPLRDLDDLAGVHHRHPMRHAGNDAEIVGDQRGSTSRAAPGASAAGRAPAPGS